MNEGVATILTMKFKLFHDYIFHFSLILKDKGRAGAVFRFFD